MEPRPSDTTELTTEDNRTPITEGMVVYNYYDGEWGRVRFIPGPFGTRYDGWFYVNDKLLNGARVSTTDPNGSTPPPELIGE